MSEIQAACQIVSREALPAQATVRLQWVDGAPVQSVGGPYTPPLVPGGTVVVPGGLAAQYEVLPQVYYPVPHSLVVRDLRGAGPVLPVELASIALSDGSTHHTVTLQGPAELADALRAGEQPAQVSVALNSDEWWFVVEEIDQPRAFARDSVTVRGRSVAGMAGEPFQAQQQWQVDAPTTAAQLATLAQTFTGLEVQWLAGDWLIPAGGFSFSGDPLGLVRALASAIGADVVADRANFGVAVRPRYAAGPNLWATTPPDWQVPWRAVESAQTQRADTPEYDGLVVAGPRQGDVLQARLAGTSGTTQAPMITDQALTDLDALRLRSAATLYSYGKQVRETRKLQIHLGRAIRDADLVRWVEPGATWTGAVRSYAIEASLSNATQTVTVERRTAWTSGTVNPAALAPPTPPTPLGLYKTVGTSSPIELPAGEVGDLLLWFSRRLDGSDASTGWTLLLENDDPLKGTPWRLYSRLRDTAAAFEIAPNFNNQWVVAYRRARIGGVAQKTYTLASAVATLPTLSLAAPGFSVVCAGITESQGRDIAGNPAAMSLLGDNVSPNLGGGRWAVWETLFNPTSFSGVTAEFDGSTNFHAWAVEIAPS